MAKNQKTQQAPGGPGEPSSAGADAQLQTEPVSLGAETAVNGDGAAEPADPVPETVPPRMVLARVLAHCYLGKPDDVVELDADLAPTMTEVADTNPAAVEYAQSLLKV